MPLFAYATPLKSRHRPACPRSALRAEVELRFGPESGARVTQFGRIYPGGSRYVCVSGRKADGLFAQYFFHHGVDDWRVYPPRGVGPSIAYWSVESKVPTVKAAPG